MTWMTSSKGRGHRAALPLLAAVLLVFTAVPGASAETQRVDRAPDLDFQFDSAMGDYGIVGVGDFNGDGFEDALFLAVETPVRSASARWLELMLGPFDIESGSPVYPATIFNIHQGDTLPSVAIADVNGDGMDDISLAAVSRRGLDPLEHQRVSVFFGRQEWRTFYFMGEASRGDRKLVRQVELAPDEQTLVTSEVSHRWADLNADGHVDLVMAVDPPEIVVSANSRGVSTTERGGGSEIVVMYGDSEWLFWEDADPDSGSQGGWVDRGAFREDVRIHGMGACANSLIGIADATGDALPDLVVRRCPGDGVPDTPALVAGGNWPAMLPIEGAIPNRPPITPGEPPKRPAPPSTGYLPPNPAPVPGESPFTARPSLFIADVDGDEIADIGMDFTDKTHIWLGGPDLTDRLLRMHTSRAYVRAGYGLTHANGTWRPTDLDGDGTKDLLVTLRPPVSLVDEAREEGPGIGRPDVPAPREPAEPAIQPMHIFRGGRLDASIVDVAREAPDLVWQDESQSLWAIGDFNGDGLDDLILGSEPGSGEARFSVVFGPVVR